MLQLYFSPGACSFVPHVMLEQAGAAFEPQMVKLFKNEHKTPEFLRLNPHGQVPVLVDKAKNQVITQIVAIVLYLDERFPNAHILPQGQERTKALSTLMWLNNTVHPTFTHVFMPEKFTDNPEARIAIQAHAKQHYAQRLTEIEALVDASHSGWLTGSQMGALDAYAFTLLRWAQLVHMDWMSYPALRTLAQRVAQQPAAIRTMERERIKPLE